MLLKYDDQHSINSNSCRLLNKNLYILNFRFEMLYFYKLLTFGLASVRSQNHRQLAGGGAATEGAQVELKEFDMEHTSNEGYKFHYANYGQDWNSIEGLPDSENKCVADIRSPINLMSALGSYGWAYGLPKSKFDDQWAS